MTNNIKLINALQPSQSNRSAYIGKVTQTETVIMTDTQGNSVQAELSFQLSWESIKAVMKLIREKAQIEESTDNAGNTSNL